MKTRLRLLAICGVLACESEYPPVAAPPTSPPTPTYVLFGTVRDTNGAALGAATAEVVSGPYAGQTAPTNPTGRFVFSALAGVLRLRVWKDGYSIHSQNLDVREHTGIDVTLEPVVSAESIVLGRAIQSSVEVTHPPCDPGGWDSRAPCRRLLFDAPATGTLIVSIAWEGHPELDATLNETNGRYVGVSNADGAFGARMLASVVRGTRYELRVHSYYSRQIFTLQAQLVP